MWISTKCTIRVCPICSATILLAELETLKTEGKIRAYGATLGPAIDIRQADESEYLLRDTKMDAVQIIYNLLEQQVGQPIFDLARQTNKGVLARVPHASDLLLGRLHEIVTFAPGDHRNWRMTSNEKKRLWLDRGLKKVEKLDFITEGTGRTIGQAALQFVLAEPSMVSPFCPTSTTRRFWKSWPAPPTRPPCRPLNCKPCAICTTTISTWTTQPRPPK